MAAPDLHLDLRNLDTVGVVPSLFSVLVLFIFAAQSGVAEEFEVMNETPNQSAASEPPHRPRRPAGSLRPGE